MDWTPAIAPSAFIFYRGSEFPKWNDNILLGTLRATDLLRLTLNGDGSFAGTELLLEDLARFRDIEQGPQGELYLLLENKAGSRIVRLVPVRD